MEEGGESCFPSILYIAFYPDFDTSNELRNATFRAVSKKEGISFKYGKYTIQCQVHHIEVRKLLSQDRIGTNCIVPFTVGSYGVYVLKVSCSKRMLIASKLFQRLGNPNVIYSEGLFIKSTSVPPYKERSL